MSAHHPHRPAKEAAKRAAKRLGDDLSLHQCVRGAGNFSIEAVAEAVMLTAEFSMRCLDSLSAAWGGLPAVAVVEQAFASVGGRPIGPQHWPLRGLAASWYCRFKSSAFAGLPASNHS